MGAENAVAKLLLDNTDVADLVIDRVSHVLSTQGDEVPRITVQRVSTNHIENLDTSSGLALALVQVDSFAATKEELDDLSDKVRLAIQGFRGEVGDYTIYVDGVSDENDLSDLPTDGTDLPEWRWVTTFRVWYCLTIPEHV